MSSTTERPAARGQHAENGSASLSERVRSLRLPDGDDSGGHTPWLPWTLAGVLLLTTVYFFLEAMTPVDDAVVAEAIEARAAELARKGGTSLAAAGGSAGSESATSAQGGDVALESKGYIIPVHQIQVSPQVGGRVLKLYVEEGKLVQKGDTLAVLEDIEYKAEYDRVAAMVRAAKARWQELWRYREDEIRQIEAELNDARAQLDQAKSKADRTEVLLQQVSASREDYEQAKSAYESRKFIVQRLGLALSLMKQGPRDLRIAAAEAEMKQAEAELVKAKWKLDNCTVTAPVTGTILTKKAEEGNMVNPAAFSNGVSASLCEMADLADLEVDLAVSERDIAKVRAGQECKVRAEAFPDRPYKGVVSRIMPIADRGKAAVPVRVKIEVPRDEAGQFLRPEMGALVTFYEKK